MTGSVRRAHQGQASTSPGPPSCYHGNVSGGQSDFLTGRSRCDGRWLPGPAQKLPLSQSRHPLSRVPTHSLHVSRVSLRLKSKAKLLSSIASWRELQKHLSLSQEVVSLQPLGESGWSDVSPAAGCEASAAAATCPASDAAALFLRGLF